MVPWLQAIADGLIDAADTWFGLAEALHFPSSAYGGDATFFQRCFQWPGHFLFSMGTRLDGLIDRTWH